MMTNCEREFYFDLASVDTIARPFSGQTTVQVFGGGISLDVVVGSDGIRRVAAGDHDPRALGLFRRFLAARERLRLWGPGGGRPGLAGTLERMAAFGPTRQVGAA